jgi:CRP-like cAMP-binding protein
VVSQQTPLVRAGDPCPSVFLLVSGWAYRQRVLPSGRRTILDIYVAGDLIGLDHLFQQRTPDSVVTLTPAGHLALDCEMLHALFRQNSDAAAEIARRLYEEKKRLEWHTVLLARLPAVERTVAGLHQLWTRQSAGRSGQERREDRAAFRVPMTQHLLADYLGLNVVHLNRTLRSLRAAGMLEIAKGTIVIDDAQRLIGAAASVFDLMQT